VLEVDNKNRPLSFVDRQAFKTAFDVVAKPAINERLFAAMTKAPQPMSLESLERLVQTFAWARGRSSTFSDSEMKALEFGLERNMFDGDAAAVAKQLAAGKTPTELGLLNTNLELPERLRAINDYLALPLLSAQQQGHLWRLLRDTFPQDIDSLTIQLVTNNIVMTVDGQVDRADRLRRCEQVFPRAHLQGRGRKPRGERARGDQAGRRRGFVVLERSCGPYSGHRSNAEPRFVRRVLESPNLASLKEESLSIVYWSPRISPATRPLTRSATRAAIDGPIRRMFETDPFNNPPLSKTVLSSFSEEFADRNVRKSLVLYHDQAVEPLR
jgi:hypothetical protein